MYVLCDCMRMSEKPIFSQRGYQPVISLGEMFHSSYLVNWCIYLIMVIYRIMGNFTGTVVPPRNSHMYHPSPHFPSQQLIPPGYNCVCELSSLHKGILVDPILGVSHVGNHNCSHLRMAVSYHSWRREFHNVWQEEMGFTFHSWNAFVGCVCVWGVYLGLGVGSSKWG